MRMARTGRQMRLKTAKAAGRHKWSTAPQKIDSGGFYESLQGSLLEVTRVRQLIIIGSGEQGAEC
jgi:hypothetical protein